MKADDTYLAGLGERMKAAREVLRMSQVMFCEQFGHSHRTYQKNEAGKSEPGITLAKTFIDAGVNANWLLSGEGPMLLRDLTSPVRLVASDQVGAYQVQPPPGLDLERLQHAIATVEEALEQTRRTMDPARKAELVLAVYDLFQEPANTHDRVLKLVTLAA